MGDIYCTSSFLPTTFSKLRKRCGNPDRKGELLDESIIAIPTPVNDIISACFLLRSRDPPFSKIYGLSRELSMIPLKQPASHEGWWIMIIIKSSALKKILYFYTVPASAVCSLLL
jgi:hypothetical protein